MRKAATLFWSILLKDSSAIGGYGMTFPINQTHIGVHQALVSVDTTLLLWPTLKHCEISGVVLSSFSFTGRYLTVGANMILSHRTVVTPCARLLRSPGLRSIRAR